MKETALNRTYSDIAVLPLVATVSKTQDDISYLFLQAYGSQIHISNELSIVQKTDECNVATSFGGRQWRSNGIHPIVFA
jgi:hypothetical protein